MGLGNLISEFQFSIAGIILNQPKFGYESSSPVTGVIEVRLGRPVTGVIDKRHPSGQIKGTQSGHEVAAPLKLYPEMGASPRKRVCLRNDNAGYVVPSIGPGCVEVGRWMGRFFFRSPIFYFVF